MATPADSWAPEFARDMLQEHGTDATISRAAQTFTPSTGALSGTPLTQTVKISPPKMKSVPVPGGSATYAREAHSFVAALDPNLTFAPADGDYVTFASRSHEVLPPVETVYSGDSIAGYKLRWGG